MHPTCSRDDANQLVASGQFSGHDHIAASDLVTAPVQRDGSDELIHR